MFLFQSSLCLITAHLLLPNCQATKESLSQPPTSKFLTLAMQHQILLILPPNIFQTQFSALPCTLLYLLDNCLNTSQAELGFSYHSRGQFIAYLVISGLPKPLQVFILHLRKQIIHSPIYKVLRHFLSICISKLASFISYWTLYSPFLPNSYETKCNFLSEIFTLPLPLLKCSLRISFLM